MAKDVLELPFDRFRRTTARRMTESITTKPQVTLHRHVHVGPLEAALAAARSLYPQADLGFSAALTAAITRGLRSSRVNGTVTDRTVRLHRSVNLGIAVDVEGTLVVPVAHQADALSVEGLAARIRELADVARHRGLRPEHVEGATFTVSNLGPLGIELFSPIVNPPQLAILGVGAVRVELTLEDGQAVGARRIGLSLSFDHAATDGADAARSLAEICRSVEEPDGLAWVDEELPDSTAVANDCVHVGLKGMEE